MGGGVDRGTLPDRGCRRASLLASQIIRCIFAQDFEAQFSPISSGLVWPRLVILPSSLAVLSTSALACLPHSHSQSQHRKLKSGTYGVPDFTELKSVRENLSGRHLSSRDKDHGGRVLKETREPEPGER